MMNAGKVTFLVDNTKPISLWNKKQGCFTVGDKTIQATTPDLVAELWEHYLAKAFSGEYSYDEIHKVISEYIKEENT